ncbi:hypothetical protein C8R46DRAFT_1210020 [Mycena filopes]|nr:hypothetical protein C8R46DRAFT_1210020 [Mycena filopes]
MLILRPLLLVSAFSTVSSALGAITLYGQCGGDDVVWPDACADGLSCVYYNFWYSQCLPAGSSAAAGT